MTRATTLVLEQVEVIELLHVVDDDDAAAALAVLRQHPQAKTHQMLEGG